MSRYSEDRRDEDKILKGKLCQAVQYVRSKVTRGLFPKNFSLETERNKT